MVFVYPHIFAVLYVHWIAWIWFWVKYNVYLCAKKKEKKKENEKGSMRAYV